MKKLSPSNLPQFLMVLLLLISIGGAHAESIATSLANLRAGPDKDSRVITALAKGTVVNVLQSQGNYMEIKVGATGMTGWVYAPAQGWATHTNALRLPAQAAQAAQAASLPTSAESETAHPMPLPLRKTHDTTAYILSGGTPVAASDIRLEMDAQDAEVLFKKDPFDQSSFPIRMQDGERALQGEISVKGSFSRRYLKKSLLISLPKGQAWQGHRKIALNAMSTDASQAREWLTWDLARALGMRIPETQYRKLYINNRYIGLYFDIEWMDNVMFERLGLANGEFYQPYDSSFCGDLLPANVSRTSTCWNKVFPGDGKMDALMALQQGLNNTPIDEFDSWLDQHFDAQSVIDWLVINTLTQNGDTYNKNYFLHYSPTHKKWRVIPWDYDLSWGRVADNAKDFPLNIHNDYFQYAFPPVVGAENPLKTKVLKNARLYARFQNRLREVFSKGNTPASGWFEPTVFQRRLANIKALVEPSLSNELFPSQHSETAHTHFEALAFFNEWRFHTLKNLLLEPSPFNTPRWLPYTSYDPLTPVTPESLKIRSHQTMDLLANETMQPGHKTAFIEKLLAYPLAFATLHSDQEPAKLTIEADREAVPENLPPGKAASQCIERTWFATLKSPRHAQVDFQFDYLQESSTRHEVGAAITDEKQLTLWRKDGKGWQQVDATFNPVANSILVQNQNLEPGQLTRFAACQ